MTRTANRLSNAEIKAAKPDPDGIKHVILPDGHGLRLVVTPTGRKHFEFKTAAGGRERTARLGSYPEMSLLDARQEAARLRQLARDGHNPVAVRRVERIRSRVKTETTFEAIANELLEGKRKNCSANYHGKIAGGLRANLYPMLGALPIQTIDAPILREALRRIEARGSLDMLGNVRRWAGEVFDFAKAQGQYVGDNPAHALVKNVFTKHEGGNMLALEWAEVPGFLHGLATMKAEPATVCAIKLLLLTACRPGEVRGARWAEFDLERRRWEIPGERMKMRKMHAVPLSEQALAVLRELKRETGDGEFLFPGRRGAKTPVISDMTLLKGVKRAAGRDVHAHGFRALFSTHVAESGKWPDAVKECALAHYKGGIEGRYDRATHYPERIKLMAWWGEQIDLAVRGADVVPIAAAK